MNRIINLLTVFLTATVIAAGCQKKESSPGAAEPGGGAPPPAAQEETEAESADPDGLFAPDEAKAAPAPAEAAAPKAEAPKEETNVFTVKLDTTKGEILVDVHPDWAPLGAERFRELVEAGYYNDVAFFRVMKNFMAQAGISGIPKLNNQWATKPIQDDKVKESNLRGMVSFAMSGANTRTCQFFINLKDNPSLDGMGFAPFAKVRDMTAVDALNAEYGDGPPLGKGPNQNELRKQGNKLLKKKYPNMDYIKTAAVGE